MNLHNQHEIDALDNYLKRKLKSLVVNKRPPEDAKTRLLKAAARGSSSDLSEVSFLFSMADRENYYDSLSIERLRMVSAFSLRIDMVGLY
jgi:hypothetical protein